MNWIDVNVEIPSDGQWVLATGYDWGDSRNKRHIVSVKYHTGVFIGENDEDYTYITHWIALDSIVLPA